MPCVLYYENQAGVLTRMETLPTAGADTNNILIDWKESEQLVLAQLPSLGLPDPVVVRVEVEEGAVGERPREMIQLVRLNRIVEDSQGSPVSDRRIFYRTMAWFRALKLVSRLTMDNWDLLLEAARQVGFFQVWVTILNQYFDPSSGENLGERFAKATRAPNFFQNTDISKVP